MEPCLHPGGSQAFLDGCGQVRIGMQAKCLVKLRVVGSGFAYVGIGSCRCLLVSQAPALVIENC